MHKITLTYCFRDYTFKTEWINKSDRIINVKTDRVFRDSYPVFIYFFYLLIFRKNRSEVAYYYVVPSNRSPPRLGLYLYSAIVITNYRRFKKINMYLLLILDNNWASSSVYVQAYVFNGNCNCIIGFFHRRSLKGPCCIGSCILFVT